MQHVVDSSVPKFQLVELLALGITFPKPRVFFYYLFGKHLCTCGVTLQPGARGPAPAKAA